jgi:large subunit ribosomal protein L13
MIVINGKNKILGRLASEVAETLLKSREKVIVVNANDVIISGDQKSVLKKYYERTEKGQHGNPENNPKYPRYSHMLVKRTVRGMLPRSPKGVVALKRLMVFLDVPEIYAKEVPKDEKLKDVEHVTLKQISKHLGAKIR